jgi:ABC-type transport system involved in multi-copper enzyme maturation permease subunit
LTPAYVAGAIADEKERKTLEFMLATDLSNHEIVLSKLLSRLANLTLFLLTGLPILSILQFLGGVDTELMLAGFAATGLTMLGIACVSILFSTLLKRSRDAIGLTYLALIAYCGVGTLGKAMAMNGARFMSEPLWIDGTGPTLADISEWFNIGNPHVCMIDVSIAIQKATLGTELPRLLTLYACFHGVLSAICIVWSIARLRAVALKQTVAGKTQKLPWWEPLRPVIGDLPMLWKELHIESRVKLNWLGWGILIALVLLTIGSGALVLLFYFWNVIHVGGGQLPELAQEINVWFRIAGTGVALLLLLMISVRAATCITHERERDTFDALLTTPMSTEAMLIAKLIGTLAGVRLGWLWLGAMVAVALLTGGLHPLAAPLLVGAWFIYAVFHAMIGLWYSMACQSSMRASVLTVLTVLFVGGGHWLLLGLCFYFPMAMMMAGGGREWIEYVIQFHLGMTPPFVLGYSAYSWENLVRMQADREFGAKLMVFSLIGLFLWAVGCVIFWYGLLLPKFRDLTRREELIYEDAETKPVPIKEDTRKGA